MKQFVRLMGTLKVASRVILCAPALWTAAEAAADGSNSVRPFQLTDYANVRRFAEVALSPDGRRVCFVVQRQSLADNGSRREVYVQEVRSGSQSVPLEIINEGRDFSWLPPTNELAFLSSRTGTTQIFAYDIKTGQARQLTETTDPVTRFRIAPNGAIAYLTVKRGESLYARLRGDGPGVLINSDTVGYRDFIDRYHSEYLAPQQVTLWIRSRAGTSEPIDIPGDAQEFAWSSDGRQLSVTYVGNDILPSLFQKAWTSIGIVDAETKRFSAFATATSSPRRMYAGGEWIPHERMIVVRRLTDPNPWIGDGAHPSLAIVDTQKAWQEGGASWNAVEIYPRGSKVIPRSRSEILIETHLRAADTLVSLNGTELVSQHPGSTDMSASSFAFSADFRTSVFVGESLREPPELYMQSAGTAPSQLTAFNQELSKWTLPTITEVSWRSRDGVEIRGWLFTPVSREYRAPWPLLTYVHGGPGQAFPNRFVPMSGTGKWPYPLEVMALRGIAVFVPQYRGTMSFGWDVAHPRRSDGEPIEDIVTGIQSLVAKGIADEARLGLAGYSHGGWLGPLTATRANIFRAGSFAEGWSNQIVLHELHPGWLNREVHEAGKGEPPLYEDPHRYLQLSSALHFRDLKMVSLFEAGIEGSIKALGMAKAARFFEIPHEFVAYPGTGHGMTSPRLEAEAAERNLDWFLFWLRDVQDSDPAKEQQYARWRAMKAETITPRPVVRGRSSGHARAR